MTGFKQRTESRDNCTLQQNERQKNTVTIDQKIEVYLRIISDSGQYAHAQHRNNHDLLTPYYMMTAT